MKATVSVWDMEALASMVRAASESFAEWQIVNEATGDVLSIEPDQPRAGMATLTLWEQDDRPTD